MYREEMTSIHFDGGDNVVLLIHGLSGNPLEMQYMAKRLQNAGFSVRSAEFVENRIASSVKRSIRLTTVTTC